MGAGVTLTLVHVLADFWISQTWLETRVAAALIANGPVDAEMAATGLLVLLALIYTTLQLICVVSAIIVPVTDEVKADTDLILTQELVLATTANQLCSSDMMEQGVTYSSVFVLSVGTIPPSVTELAKGHASRATGASHEVCWTNFVFAHARLIAVILAVIVAVTEEVVEDTSVVGTFEFIFLADVVADCQVFV